MTTAVPPPASLSGFEERTRSDEAGDAAVLEALGLQSRPRGWGVWLFRFTLLLVVLGGLGAAGYYGWQRYQSPPLSFRTATLEKGDVFVVVSATGTLSATRTVDVGLETSGRIIAVYVDYNTPVKKGQLLAEIDDAELEARRAEADAQVKVAEAGILESQATLEEAQLTFKRENSLRERNATTEERIAAAKAAVARSDAQVSRCESQLIVAKQNLKAAETNLRKAKIYSPIDGVVLSRTVEPGQTHAAAFQTPLLFQIVEDLKRMELHVDVDEADVGRVVEGQAATFTVDAYGDKVFPTKVESLYNAPQTEQNVVTYEGVLPVDNSEGLLRPGMTATASIVTDERRDVLLVPNAALRFTPPEGFGGWKSVKEKAQERRSRVWTLKDGQPTPVLIETGATDGRFTQVVSGDVTVGTVVILEIEQ
ncbi:MAG TPA: efflux RND transporter periplasmic adaptor subunit [Pirellulales bacterium]